MHQSMGDQPSLDALTIVWALTPGPLGCFDHRLDSDSRVLASHGQRSPHSSPTTTTKSVARGCKLPVCKIPKCGLPECRLPGGWVLGCRDPKSVARVCRLLDCRLPGEWVPSTKIGRSRLWVPRFVHSQTVDSQLSGSPHPKLVARDRRLPVCRLVLDMLFYLSAVFVGVPSVGGSGLACFRDCR